MGRRGRSFFGLVLVGAGAVALYLWRNRRMRELTLALIAPASECVRDFVKRTLRPMADAEHGDVKPKLIITGLAAPEARPLSSADQLMAWRPPPHHHLAAPPDADAEAHVDWDPDAPFCRTYNAPLMAGDPATGAAAAVRGSGAPLGCRPRLLVCHDMMGGYLADRWVQGADDPGAFRLWQWDQVDVFVYFSHHLITLPPPGWIAAAHRNGVRVLGTFITEWAAGRALCEQDLFRDAISARRAADQLAALAAYHGFEGWLVNVENGMRRELVPHLQHFVAHLRARMAAEVGPQAMVVWYDAITTEGRLAWQDGLTPRNAPFFDAADALFVNYRWKEDAPAAVAAAAGSRAAEVYLGVDVFGRGSYGGGKDNCPVALAAARSAGLSAALFAPGWVYEEFDRATFEPRQEAFWAAIRAVWPSRPALLQRLPLASCFGSGAGRAVWLEGRRVSTAPWHNLAAQDVVATTTTTNTSTTRKTTTAAAATATAASSAPGVQLVVRTTHHLAFTGGSCLELTTAATATAGAARATSPPSAAAAATATGARALPAAATDPSRGLWLHQLYSAHLPVPTAGLDLSYTVACSGTSRVAVLLRVATAAAAAAGAAAPCGVAVGAWGPGDGEVVEALRRTGYTCVACLAAPTGATTCPLSDPPLAATAAAAPAHTLATSAFAAAAASVAAAPSGLPWVTLSAHLPTSLLHAAGAGAAAAGGPAAGAAAAAAIAIVGIGVVCFTASAAAAGGDGGGDDGASLMGSGATGGAGAAGGGGGGAKSSVRSSAVRYSASASAAGTTAADGGEGEPFKAFLGRLVLREHRPTDQLAALSYKATVPQAASDPAAGAAAAPAAAVAAGPLPVPMVTAAPPQPLPLNGSSCFRVHWSRPDGTRLRPRRASSNSLTAPSGPAVATLDGAADPRVSGELVETDDEDWERSSGSAAGGGGGGGLGGSPVKVAPAGRGDHDGVEADDAMHGVELGVEGDEGEEEASRLLTCELSWEPQFDAWGLPRHRSYHVWAHCSATEAPPYCPDRSPQLPPGSTPLVAAAAASTSSAGVAAAAGAPLGRSEPAAAGGGGAAAGGGGAAAGGGEEREGAWELLHPGTDWSGAVWAGEAFVARYRLVQLEVPGWARWVTLLAQPVSWEGAELQAMQPLACLPVPRSSGGGSWDVRPCRRSEGVWGSGRPARAAVLTAFRGGEGFAAARAARSSSSAPAVCMLPTGRREAGRMVPGLRCRGI